MKRFHVHVAVKDLESSIRFYSSIFAHAPTVTKPDYAKWMLEDPRVNFAISTRSAELGINHLGFQVDNDAELTGMREQLTTADASLQEEHGVACCYARSDKYWVTDPTGIAWETFHSLGAVPVFGEADIHTAAAASCGRVDQIEVGGCCAPSANPAAPASGCCS